MRSLKVNKHKKLLFCYSGEFFYFPLKTQVMQPTNRFAALSRIQNVTGNTFTESYVDGALHFPTIEKQLGPVFLS